MKRSLLFSAFLLLCFACTKPLPTLEGVEMETWKGDRNACLGLRTQYVQKITDQRDKLKGLSEAQVVKLLSKPDMNHLIERNEKQYYYFMTPSPGCGKEFGPHFTYLIIRFNATGVSREVTIESY